MLPRIALARRLQVFLLGTHRFSAGHWPLFIRLLQATARQAGKTATLKGPEEQRGTLVTLATRLPTLAC